MTVFLLGARSIQKIFPSLLRIFAEIPQALTYGTVIQSGGCAEACASEGSRGSRSDETKNITGHWFAIHSLVTLLST